MISYKPGTIYMVQKDSDAYCIINESADAIFRARSRKQDKLAQLSFKLFGVDWFLVDLEKTTIELDLADDIFFIFIPDGGVADIHQLMERPKGLRKVSWDYYHQAQMATTK